MRERVVRRRESEEGVEEKWRRRREEESERVKRKIWRERGNDKQLQPPNWCFL